MVCKLIFIIVIVFLMFLAAEVGGDVYHSDDDE